MSTVISPALTPPGAARTTAGPARANDPSEGKRFNMAFEQSRAASAPRTDTRADTADAADAADMAELEPGEGRRGARGHERKSKLTAADVMAMLAPLPAPVLQLGSAASLTGAATAHAAAAGVRSTGLPGADGPAGLAAATVAAGPAGAAAASDAADAAPTGDADAATAGPAADAGTALAQSAPSPADGVPVDARAAADSATALAATRLASAAGAAGASAAARAARPASGADAGRSDAAANAAGNALPALDADGAVTGAAGSAAAGALLDTDPDTGAGVTADTRGDDGASVLPWQPGATPTARNAAPASTTPVLSLAPPVGDDAWGPAIAQQLIRMNASGHHEARLNLNPADLGPLKVTLSINDNQTQAMFVSAHESVRKAVEAALPQLRSTLAAQGIALGHTSVGAESQQSAGHNSAFAGQDPSPRQRGQADYPGSTRSATAAPTPGALPPARSRPLSGLDTFA